MIVAQRISPTESSAVHVPPQSLDGRRTIEPGAATAPVSGREIVLLGTILLLSLILQVTRLDLQGLGNPYYAATVRSMLSGWRLFFFASFDPGGFVAVDKPPLGFWVQTVSARLLGFGGVALILPQALATVGAVVLIWKLARDAFGRMAGLVAALVLCLTPISVAAGRTNTLDPLLVFVLLLASWALLKAIEHDRDGWFLLSAVLIGVAFNVKMLQAYLIVPAWGATFLLASRGTLRHRVALFALATALLLAVSASWSAVVQFTPAGQRPYVGSSTNNSPFDLALGYNGLQRLLPASMTETDDPATNGPAAPTPGAILGALGQFETGDRGPLRLFDPLLATQIAWFLPLALLGGAAGWFQGSAPWFRMGGGARAALLFWGGWLLTAAAFFSVANQFHRYYLVMLAPPIAVLVGNAVSMLWREWRRPDGLGWLLPLGVAAQTIYGALLVAPFADAVSPLSTLVVGSGAIAAAGLAAIRWKRQLGGGLARPGASALTAAALAVGAVAVLLGPAVWSGWALGTPVSNVLPAAGPGGSLLAGPGGAAVPGLDRYVVPDAALVTFLTANQKGERYALATANSLSAAPLIIAADMPVAALGGFIGQDPVLTVPQLQGMVARGEVRYFLTPDPGRVGLLTTMMGAFGGLTAKTQSGFPLPGQAPPPRQETAARPDPAVFLRLFLTDTVRWVAASCEPVPPKLWQTPDRGSSNPLTGLEILYDCRGAAEGDQP